MVTMSRRGSARLQQERDEAERGGLSCGPWPPGLLKPRVLAAGLATCNLSARPLPVYRPAVHVFVDRRRPSWAPPCFSLDFGPIRSARQMRPAVLPSLLVRLFQQPRRAALPWPPGLPHCQASDIWVSARCHLWRMGDGVLQCGLHRFCAPLRAGALGDGRWSWRGVAGLHILISPHSPPP